MVRRNGPLLIAQQHGIANSRMAVVVQTMVPDVRASGVFFTSAVSYREKDDMLVNAAWGLGQAVVDGKVTPDAIRVDKQSLEIVQRETAIKTVMTVLDDNTTRQEAVPKEQQDKPVLTDKQVKVLAKPGQQVEDHYTGTHMDVAWALSKDGTISILQARRSHYQSPATTSGCLGTHLSQNCLDALTNCRIHAGTPFATL